MRLLHWPAMILTGIGPFALILSCFDGEIVLRCLKLTLGGSASSRHKNREREAYFLHKLGSKFYDEGASVFESVKTGKRSSFVKKLVERLSLHMPMPDVRELSEIERFKEETRLQQCLNLANLGVRLTPSIGMLGTILGMVRLLSTLEDPSQLGSQMSLALLTTFYGLFFSLVIWTPIQQKLERILEIEMEGCDQALHWLDLLERRKPPTYFSEAADFTPSDARSA